MSEKKCTDEYIKISMCNLEWAIHAVSQTGTGPGRPRVGSGRAKSDALALDPRGAGPDDQNSGPTLALLGSGRVDPRANLARPDPWTV
jgi:hypothetical protein